MKKISSFIALAIAATILSGCYVAPYSPYYGGQYRQRGSQCPPPIKVDLNITKMKKKKFDCEREPECEQPCRPACQPVYKPICPY
jgi:hypothetical protein